MLPLEHYYAILLTCIKQYFVFFLSGGLRQILLYNQQSIYIYAYKCLCQCVGKVYYPNVDCSVWYAWALHLENDPPFFAPWVISAYRSWKKECSQKSPFLTSKWGEAWVIININTVTTAVLSFSITVRSWDKWYLRGGPASYQSS